MTGVPREQHLTIISAEFRTILNVLQVSDALGRESPTLRLVPDGLRGKLRSSREPFIYPDHRREPEFSVQIAVS